MSSKIARAAIAVWDKWNASDESIKLEELIGITSNFADELRQACDRIDELEARLHDATIKGVQGDSAQKDCALAEKQLEKSDELSVMAQATIDYYGYSSDYQDPAHQLAVALTAYKEKRGKKT